MAIKPILFNAEMVRAILDGRKTCTRRICKDANEYTVPDMDFYNADRRTYAVHNFADKEQMEQLSTVERTCPICPGDILYVRETWGISNLDDERKMAYIVYRASEEQENEGCREVHLPDEKFEKMYESMAESEPEWHPSIHMPKEAARIWLKVTDVRVERLQEITPDAIKNEGIILNPKEYVGKFDYTSELYFLFQRLWNSTIKKSDLDRYGWDANPYVFVIEFERCEKTGEEELCD